MPTTATNTEQPPRTLGHPGPVDAGVTFLWREAPMSTDEVRLLRKQLAAAHEEVDFLNGALDAAMGEPGAQVRAQLDDSRAATRALQARLAAVESERDKAVRRAEATEAVVKAASAVVAGVEWPAGFNASARVPGKAALALHDALRALDAEVTR